MLVAYAGAADLLTDRTATGMLSARGMTLDAMTWALAQEMSLAATTPGELIAGAKADPRAATVVIGELDECGVQCDGAAAHQIITELLEPLLGLQNVRLLVEARSEVVSVFETPAQVVQLDDPALTDRDGFRAWLRCAAADNGVTDPAVLRSADAAFPNAGLALTALQTGPEPNAIDHWLRSLPVQAWPALEALAATYEPLDQQTWTVATLANAGVETETRAAMLAAMPFTILLNDRRTVACRPIQEALRQARTGDVRVRMDRAIDQALYAAQPPTPTGEIDWRSLSPYARRHLLRHVVRSGDVSSLLGDPVCLTQADPVAVTAVLEAMQSPSAHTRAWRFAGRALLVGESAAERAALLHLGALHLQDVEAAEQFLPQAADAAWTARWVLARPTQAGTGHWPGAVTALSCGEGERDGELIASSRGGMLHLLSQSDGSSIGRLVSKEVSAAHGIAVFPDGELLVLTVNGSLRLVNSGSSQSRGARIASLLNSSPSALDDADGVAAPSAVLAAVESSGITEWAALGTDPQTSQLALGDGSGTVHAWDLSADLEAAATASLHTGPVTAVTCMRGDRGDRLVLSGGADGKVRLWRPGIDPMPEPAMERDHPVTALTAGLLASRPVMVVGWSDGDVVVADLLAGMEISVRLPYKVTALALLKGTLFVGSVHGVAALDLKPPRPSATLA